MNKFNLSCSIRRLVLFYFWCLYVPLVLRVCTLNFFLSFQYKRRLLIVDDERVLVRFAPAFAEERAFRMSHFLVCKIGEGKQENFYFKLQMNSVIQRDVVYLPRHCFYVLTLPQILAGYADGLGLYGIWFSLFHL